MKQLPVWPAVACDLVCVVVFTLVGTANHASGGSVAHVLAVGAPFVVGLAVGWLASRAWRAPAQPWPTGVAIWFATVVLGLALRPLFTGGFAWSFALVTAVFLAVTMLGWRLLATLAQRRAA
ncbi:DUF3054 domain-containing protein [Isoptericola croceus]|uniref:DUF3054 domain-containing protein n=1 Tax=Isoptericola croceus TaxID=3031406 RepID=UPI0023F8F864|nr:DUF3054 domain-containing protein [Isoptericola croceus]